MSEAGSIAMGGGAVADAAVAIPVRYWWLKRIGVAAGILVVLLGAMRWYWGVEADRRLLSEIARIQAAGEPIYPEDFDPPEPVPDENNAALLIQRAANKFTLDKEQKDKLRKNKFRFWMTHPEEAEAILSQNVESLRLLGEASRRERVDWGLRIRTPAFRLLVPQLSAVHPAKKLLILRAARAYAEGDHETAIRTLRELHALAALVNEMGLVVSHFSALSISKEVVLAVEQISPGLLVADSLGADRALPRPATRATVDELILDLLDEQWIQQGWLRGTYVERMMHLDAMRALSAGVASFQSVQAFLGGGGNPSRNPTWVDHLRVWALAPQIKSDLLVVMGQLSQTGRVADDLLYRSAMRKLPLVPYTTSRFGQFLAPFSSGMWDPHGALRRRFHQIAMRRMAAIRLAVRLYELDYGQRPGRLADCVPDYVRSVPRDPFSEDGNPIGYVPARESAVLYSVGSNGIDENGHYEYERRHWLKEWDNKDIPFFLNGDRPHAQRKKEIPTGSPVEGDEDGGG